MHLIENAPKESEESKRTRRRRSRRQAAIVLLAAPVLLVLDGLSALGESACDARLRLIHWLGRDR